MVRQRPGGIQQLHELNAQYGGALTFDFQHLLGMSWPGTIRQVERESAVDAFERAHEALVHVEQISYRTDSHLAAAIAGGMEFLGWTADRHLLADARELLLILASSWAGKKLGDPITRPLKPREEVELEQAATIADFNPDAFLRWLMT